MEYVYIAVFISSFLFCLAAVYSYLKWNGKKEFAMGIDINKGDKPKIPESGGIAVLLSIWILFLAFSYLSIIDINYKNFSWLLLLTGFSAIGIFDDTKHKFLGKAVPWLARALPIALLSFGFAYLFSGGNLLLAAAGAFFIAGIASFHNTFAGLNGWEVGSSFIISIFASVLLYGGSYFIFAQVISACALALLIFNSYPARIFPGDSGTLLFGSAIAGLVFLNGDARIMVIVSLFYLPHAVDFFLLKLLTNTKDVSQSKVKPYALKDGKIAIPKYEGKTRYDFAKLIVKIFGPLEEWKIAIVIWLAVIVNCSFWILVSRAF